MLNILFALAPCCYLLVCVVQPSSRPPLSEHETIVTMLYDTNLRSVTDVPSLTSPRIRGIHSHTHVSKQLIVYIRNSLALKNLSNAVVYAP